jgi:NADH:ubiquinone reductase (H+-translocating)
MKHIVIAGGGFAGVRLARKLRKSRNIEVTLINDGDNFRYSPALYRAATGFKMGIARIPLEWMLIDSGNIDIVNGRVQKIDPKTKRFKLTDGRTISYDYAVCVLGSVTTYFNIDGIADHSFGVKSPAEIMELKKHIHDSIANNKQQRDYVVIGAGPTGVEVASMLGAYVKKVMKRHRVKNRHISVYLVEASGRILPQMAIRASNVAARKLRKLGVQILVDTKVTSETSQQLKTSAGNIKTQNVIWTAGAANNPFYAENAPHFMFNQRGKVKVDKHLQALPNIYVAGDNADTPFSGLALTAVWHANSIAKDIQARIKRNKRPIHKDRKPAQVIPIGSTAVLQYRGFVLHGWLISLVRRIADFIGYSDVLGPLKAATIWASSEEPEDICHTCKR